MVRSRIKQAVASFERKWLGRMAEWAIKRAEEKYDFSYVYWKIYWQGYHGACEFIEDNFRHFVEGHPEMTTRDFVEWVRYQKEQSKPEPE